MAVVDVESKFEEKIRQAGLMPFFSANESHFLDLEGDLFVEIVARDSTKLPEFGRIADEVRAENPSVKTLVRAHWEVENVGDPVQAYDIPGTGSPRAAVQYPVRLRAGDGDKQVWVEVTTLASMVFKDHGFDFAGIKRVVHSLVVEQLTKGGASYWDPIRFPQLEINGDMAEYISSTRSPKQ
jgi:hypothetical protein